MVGPDGADVQPRFNQDGEKTRAERGKEEIIPARRAHAVFIAASESRAVKRPFDRSGLGSLFYFSREYGADSENPNMHALVLEHLQWILSGRRI